MTTSNRAHPTFDLLPVIGPDGVPLQLFGNAVVLHPFVGGIFGIVDRHGAAQWFDIDP